MLVVTRPMFERAIAPLVAHRRGQGFEVEVTTRPVSLAMADARRKPPQFLLLVGDWRAGAQSEPWAVPSRESRLYRWHGGQRETFAADALWGDLDGDGWPEVPLGRIPARTAREAELVARKILAFEKQAPDAGGLKLPIWAGAPGYGPLVDSLATSALVAVAQGELPAWAEPWLQSGDPGHALCGWPESQVEAWNARLGRPALMGLMVGHGREESFHSMALGGRSFDYRVQDAFPLDKPGRVFPPMVVLTCSSGRFDGERQSLAERLLFAGSGPVAVVAATTESHPVTNYYTGVEVARAMGRSERRLGRMWLAAQRRARAGENILVEQALLGSEGSLEKRISLGSLRRDQERMYALLGDPATLVPLPAPLDAKIERTAEGLHWKVERPEGAAVLELGFRPRGLAFPPARQGSRALAEATREEANALFAFRSLLRRSASEAWEGTLRPEGPGTLRFVALTDRGIHAAAQDVKP
jgi:hypothetical protein